MLKIHEEREAVTLINEGQKIFGIFHRPLLHKPFPAVLICHGLAGHKSGRYRIYVDLAEQLTHHGIAVLRIDFRGSGDSEGEFMDMTLTGEVSDALLGLKFLHEHEGVDEERIGLFGRSLGGPVAIMAAADFRHCKSLALWSAIYSGDQWHDRWEMVKNNNGHPEQLLALRTINGQIGGIPFFEELFTMKLEHHLAKLNHLPLFNVHGLKDEVVLPSHAEAYKMHRKSAKAPSKFLFLPESDHDLTLLAERKKAIHETCLWFKDTL